VEDEMERRGIGAAAEINLFFMVCMIDREVTISVCGQPEIYID